MFKTFYVLICKRKWKVKTVVLYDVHLLYVMRLIKDPIHGDIVFSRLEATIFSHMLFNRLHHILQNSMSYMVYPANKTSRFIHSIGVAKVATDIFSYGVKNADYITINKYFLNLNEFVENFFETNYNNLIQRNRNYRKYATKVYQNNEINFNIIKDNLYEIFGEYFINEYLNDKLEDEKKFVLYYIFINVLRYFALMHDFGHLPFSHLTEFSLDKISENILNEVITVRNNDLKNNFVKLSDLDEQIHEIIGKKISLVLLRSIKEDFIQKLENDEKKFYYEVFFELFIDILRELHKGKNGKFLSIYEIVSSDFDADRIDYTLRDGFATSLINDGADIDRIVKTYCLYQRNDSENYLDEFRFYPAIQALYDIDEIFIDRSQIYRAVINHHKVKRYDYLLQKAIEILIKRDLSSGSNRRGDVEVKTAIDMASVIFDIIYKPEDDLYRIKDGIFYKYSQLTDYWLLSLIKEREADIFNQEDGSDEEYSILNEIFTGANGFQSIWKRDYEFIEFAKKVQEGILTVIRDKNLFDEDKFYYLKGITDELIFFATFLNREPEVLSFVEKKFEDNNEQVLLAKAKNASPPGENFFVINIKDKKIHKYLDISTRAEALMAEKKKLISFFVFCKRNEDIERVKGEMTEYFKQYVDQQRSNQNV